MNKKKPSYRRRAGKSLAEKADRHTLYQESVQCVEAEIDMIDENFKKLRKRQAHLERHKKQDQNPVNLQ